MKVYTKTGDKGSTRLIGGLQVSKSDIRLDAYGTVDELNAYIGMVYDVQSDASQMAVLDKIRNLLFVIGANLANEIPQNSKVPAVDAADVKMLEDNIDLMSEALPELRHFVLPGGHVNVSHCHIARTICRRAERVIVKLTEVTEVHDQVGVFMNRLSDYLFVLGRKVGYDLGVNEVLWKPEDQKQ